MIRNRVLRINLSFLIFSNIRARRKIRANRKTTTNSVFEFGKNKGIKLTTIIEKSNICQASRNIAKDDDRALTYI